MTIIGVADLTDPRGAESSPTRVAGLTPRGWERIGLAGLLIGTAVAYLWRITINGMGNSFYAAAAWSGSRNWEALLFGSVDPANFITVDKPPVSQWVMGLSGQLFRFSSASMLVPEALMAVASVALVYGAVARVASRGAGLLAGTILAVEPVVAMMFRFNNPDAVMVLLMTAAAYCTVRALPKASVRWLALAGVALGFAFLAKMLEGLMVLPALGIAYLVAAPVSLGRRMLHLAAAAVALVVSSGWYVLLTLSWPAATRPYLAGSTDNSFMNLVIGYNGLARVLGRQHGPAGTGGPPGGWQPPAGVSPHAGGAFGANSAGITRLFSGEIGFEISWLLPAALVALALVLVARRRTPRTDLTRATALVFGLWLIVDGLVLSMMRGGMHAYYSMAIAPAIAALVGLGAHEMSRLRERRFGRFGAAAMILASGLWGFVLLDRNSDWLPWLRWVVLTLTVIAAAAMAGFATRRFAAVLAIVGVVAGLAGSTAYAAATIDTPHTGGSPAVGPAQPSKPDHDGPGGPGGPGGFGSPDPNPELDALLSATSTRWSAAIDRSSPAAALELSSDTAVMAIGGFMNDPTPTLAQFQDDVRAGAVTYYITEQNARRDGTEPGADGGSTAAGPQQGRGNRPSGHADIADWVTATFTPRTVGNAVVYDLTGWQG